jgi:hypothetical protein
MDVYGKPITESVDIMFDNQRLVEPLRVTQQHTNGRLKIDGLQDAPNDLYRISIEHPSYLPVQQFVRISSQTDPVELTFPVDISRITGKAVVVVPTHPQDSIPFAIRMPTIVGASQLKAAA